MEPQKNINTYSVQGKLYAIPNEKNDEFLQSMPKAQSVYAYEVNGKKLGIPKEKVNDFLNDMPGAKALYDYPELNNTSVKPVNGVDYGPFDKETVEKSPQAKQNFERWQQENHTDDQNKPDEKKQTGFFENTGFGRGIYSGSKGAVGSMGSGIEEGALKINQLLKNIPVLKGIDSYQNWLNKEDERIKGNIEDVNKWKNDVPELKGTIGEKIGGLMPFASMVIGTALTKSPAMAEATAGMFGTMGYGEGIEAYDNYKKEKGEPLNEAARTGAGLLYAAVYSIPLGEYAKGVIPKGLFNKAASKILNPEIMEKSGKTIWENFIKTNPAAAKLFAVDMAKNTGKSVMTMEQIELGKLAVDKYLIGRDVSPKEFWQKTIGGLESGIIFSVLTGPFAAYSQSTSNISRRRQQGSVVLGMTKDGKSFEVVPDGKGGNKGLTPENKLIDLNQDDLGNTVKIPTETFEKSISEGKKNGKQLYEGAEYEAVKGNLTDFATNITIELNGQPTDQIHTFKDANGETQFVKRIYDDGSADLVSEQGQQSKIAKVPTEGVFNTSVDQFVNEGMQRRFGAERTGEAAANPPQGAITVNPADAKKAEVEDFVSKNLHEDGSLTKITDDENNQYFVASGHKNDPDGTLIVYDPNAPSGKRGISVSDLQGDPESVTPDEFVQHEMARFNQEQQVKQEIENQSITLNGQKYLVLGEVEGDMALQPIDENNQPVNANTVTVSKKEFEAEQEKQQQVQVNQQPSPSSSEQPVQTVVNTVQIGKNNYKYTNEPDGSFAIQLDEGQDPVKAEKEIRSTLPDNQQNRVKLIQETVDVPSTVPWVAPSKKTLTKSIVILPETQQTNKDENIQSETEKQTGGNITGGEIISEEKLPGDNVDLQQPAKGDNSGVAELVNTPETVNNILENEKKLTETKNQNVNNQENVISETPESSQKKQLEVNNNEDEVLQKLRELGYSDEEINTMTPEDELRIFRNNILPVLPLEKEVSAAGESLNEKEAVRIAESEVNTKPTEEQKKAGNYKMGHARFSGFDITIENPVGSTRSGKDSSGKKWSVTMKNTYGYFKRTKGKDGDQIDFFLGSNNRSNKVYVVDQVDPKTQLFDEHKVMLGFNSEETARKAYLSNYETNWQGLGAITELSKDDFKKWLKQNQAGTRAKRKPVSELVTVKNKSNKPSFSKEELQIRKENRAKALAIEPINLEQLILQYISSGNRLNYAEIKREVFPRSKSELNQRIWMLKGDAPTIDELLVKKSIVSGTPFEQEAMEPNVFRSAVLEVVLRNTTLTDMTDRILAIGTGQGDAAQLEQDKLAEAMRSDEIKENQLIDEVLEEMYSDMEKKGILPSDIELNNLFLDDNGTEESNIAKGSIQGKDEGTDQQKSRGNGEDATGDRQGGTVSLQPEESTGELTSLENNLKRAQQDYNSARNNYNKLNDRLKSSPEFGNKGQKDIFGGEAGSDVLDFGSDELTNARKAITDAKIKMDNAGDEVQQIQKQIDNLKGNIGQGNLFAGQAKQKKEPWEMALVYVMSNKSENDFPIKSKVEVINGKPVYTSSTTVKWGDTTKTITVTGRTQPSIEKLHKEVIKQALSEGKKVPEEVLKDYPDLKQKEPFKTPFEKEMEDAKSETEGKKKSVIIQGSNIKPSQDVKKIDDFGEKIEGAKKDLYSQLQKTTQDDIISMPLSKSFPRPDFVELVKNGELSKDAALITKFLYDNIPAKPRKKYRVGSWAKVVQDAINIYSDFLSKEGMDKKWIENLEKSDTYYLLKNKWKIFKEIQEIFGFPEYDVNTGVYEIKEFIGSVGKRISIVKGQYIIANFNTVPEAALALKKIIDNNKIKSKETKFSVYQDIKTKQFFIGKKTATGVLRLMEGLDKKLAFDILKNQDSQLQEIWSNLKIIPEERRLINRNRVGIDYRKGENITPDKFGDTFGFRGIQFGNWVNNDERQSALNDAYDAFMDLSTATGVSPDALSLGGQLGVAFGARGSGKFSAHYEPGQVVINLTKTRGAGSLAHEWWHALDNYFSRKRGGKSSYITENPRAKKISQELDESIRKEMLDSFKGVVDAIRLSDLSKRSFKLDNTRSKLYWSDIIEMSARSFENFIIEKLGQTNEQNDYLANFKEMGEWIGQSGLTMDNYPYPTKEESPGINESFQNLFNTIEEKQEGKTTVLFKRGNIFYSPTEKALNVIKQEKGTPEQFKAMLLKNGAKQAELDWMGFDEFSQDKKSLTKAEIQEWIDQNKVEVKEVVKGDLYGGKYNISANDIENINNGTIDARNYFNGETPNDEEISRIKNTRNRLGELKGEFPDWFNEKEETTEERELQSEIDNFNTKYNDYIIFIDRIRHKSFEQLNDTKYSQYQTPGGENYKEVLLTMPSIEQSWKSIDDFKQFMRDKYGDGWKTKMSKYENDSFESLINGESKRPKQTFKSSHFDEPNILAHIRFNERTDSEGNRVLFIEEIQSDWAQKGKKEGFKPKKSIDSIRDYYIKKYISSTQTYNELSPEDKLLIDNTVRDKGEFIPIQESGQVPDMPFKQTPQWVNLALRRMIRYAAENGFDKIAWTTGEQQASRYDLSKQVDSIETKKERNGLYTILANKDGKDVFTQSDIQENQLEGIIGKDLAKKIIDFHNDVSTDWHSFSGIDLQVGGEGMKAFYDQIVPNLANKLGKKFGAKVEEIDINNGGKVDMSSGVLDLNKEVKVLSLPITPEMKRSAMEEGVPMFNRNTQLSEDISGINGPDKKHEASVWFINEMNELSGNLSETVVVKNQDELYRRLKSDGISKGAIEQIGNEFARLRSDEVIKGFELNNKIYLLSEFNSGVQDLAETWLHETTHDIVRREFTRGELEELFDAVGDEYVHSVIHQEDRKLTKSQQGNELIAYSVSDLLSGNKINEILTGNVKLNDLPLSLQFALHRVTGRFQEYGKNNHAQYGGGNANPLYNERQQKSGGEIPGDRKQKPGNEPVGSTGTGKESPFLEDILASDNPSNPSNPDIRFRKSKGESQKEKVKNDNFLDEFLPKAAERYLERETARDWKQTIGYVREFWQDVNLPIRRLEEEVSKRGGRIWNKTKPYRDINLSFGRMEELYREFHDENMKPVLEAIGDLVEKSGINRDYIIPYMYAKHAEERNRDMRMAEFDNWLAVKEADGSEVTTADRNSKLNELDEKDYSGVSAFDPDHTFKNPDDLASAIVEEFENNIDKGLIDNLWGAVNKATNTILDHWFAGGQISEKSYNKYKTQYKYFVPLRGWRHGMGKLLRYNKSEGFGRSLRHAEGRVSLADNPLAYMESVAFKSIGERVTNEINQSLLNLVMANYDREKFADMYAVKKVYYLKGEQYNPETGEMEEVWDVTLVKPDQELFASGDARAEYYREHMKLRSGFEGLQHEVLVRKDGGDVVVVFSDNLLSTAQAFNRQNTIYAINGKLYDAVDFKGLSKLFGGFGLTNFMKGMFTSNNPVFPFTNFFRDLPEASFTLIIADANPRVIKNVPKAMATVRRKLFGKPNGGILDKQLNEFYEVGGATGFTHEKTPEEVEKDLKKELDRILKRDSLHGKMVIHTLNVFEVIRKWNQLFEDTTRFSVYLSSLEAGKSKEDAALDAKEASVNFNRKGKSTKLFDSIWAFFNPAIQAAQKNFKLAKDHPGRFAAVAGAVVLAGFIEALLNELFEEDDEYNNISEYVRQNYLIAGTGKKYIRVPLPQFWRGFHSLGVISYDLMKGKTTAGKAIAQTTLNFLGGLSPVDVPGFWMDGEFSLAPVIPTWAKPVYEANISNRDFMGSTIAKEPFTKALQEQLASSSLNKKNVNPALKAVTDFLSKDIGGKYGDLKVDVRDGKIKRLNYLLDWNPSKIEHLVSSYLGGAGKVMSDFTTTMLQLLSSNEEVNINNIPFVNSFVRNTPDKKWKVIEKYYDIKALSQNFGAVENYAKRNMDVDKLVDISPTKLKQLNIAFGVYDDKITDLIKYYGMDSEEGSKEVTDLMQEAVDFAEELIKE